MEILHAKEDVAARGASVHISVIVVPIVVVEI
jgi:hypothetical protein